MKKLAVLLSLSMSSSLALASSDNATFELTSAQMDNITAGASFSGTANGWASAAGDFPSIYTHTSVNAHGNASGTGSVVSFALAQAKGNRGTATNTDVTTHASGNSRTYNISTDHQGHLFSQSADLEITISVPNMPTVP